MNFDEAKKELIKDYTEAGLELADQNGKELYFKKRNLTLLIDEDEINDYALHFSSSEKIEDIPSCECGIVNNNYREQLVTSLGRFGPSIRGLCLGDASSDEMYIEIGFCSNTFLNYFRFDEQFLNMVLDRHRFNSSRGTIKPTYNFLTIKFYNIGENSIADAIKKTDSVVSSVLFSLASLKKFPCSLANEWPSSRLRMRDSKDPRFFEYEVYRQDTTSNSIPLKKMKINPVILKFYQQAVSSDIESLQYLAYYQVIENFFITVSDENLYSDVSRIINDIRFKSDRKHIDKIINKVNSHKRESDETEMLKNVLRKYTDEDDIIDFIRKYETYLDHKIYTSKRNLFGIDIQSIELKQNHVFGNVAKIIKTIRNALVHSTDRYERNDRYIPFSKEHTELLQKELPLIKFLAEKVITATATTIS